MSRKMNNKSWKQYGYMHHEMDVKIENLSTVLANIKANGAKCIDLHYIDGYEKEDIVVVRFATGL